MKTPKDDFTRRRLGLAAQCLAEAPLSLRGKSPRLDRRIDSITKEAWRVWWEHRLRNTQAIVPHLTSALPVLARWNGKVARGKTLLTRVADHLRSTDWPAAARALGEMAPASATEQILARLAGFLRDTEGAVREAAAAALGHMAPLSANEEVLAHLADSLRDSEASVRRAAAWALYRMGPASATEEILACLADSLRDRDLLVWQSAASALALASSTQGIPVCLADRLQDPQWQVREAAVAALVGSVPLPMNFSVPCWLEPDDDLSFKPRARGRPALASATEEILTCLTHSLQDSEALVRAAAARALGEMAPGSSEEILARLGDCLRDSKEHVRTAAEEALGRIAPASAPFPVRAAHLQRAENLDSLPDFETAAAAIALGRETPGSAKEDIVARLAAHLRDPDLVVRAADQSALGEMAPVFAGILAHLTDSLRNPRWNVRSTAAWALGRMAPASATEKLLACLTHSLRDPNSCVRRSAAWALGRMAPASATEKILACLAHSLRDSEPDVRIAAAAAAARIAQEHGWFSGWSHRIIPLAELSQCEAPDEDL
jgi:HEAT repeat protein